MTRQKTLKRVMGKAERRARRSGPRSEFIVMCERVALDEQIRRDRADRIRHESEAQRRREVAVSTRAA